MILSFKPQFKEPILAGTKIHTLRADPNQRWKVGMTAQMATGVRTKNYECFKEVTIKAIQEVKISYDQDDCLRHYIDGKDITGESLTLSEFAHNDGFDIYLDLLTFFGFMGINNGLRFFIERPPLNLRLLHWTDFTY